MEYNLKPLVNNVVLYEDFLIYLQLELDKVHKDLETYTDSNELLRLQGDARRIRRLMALRERINNG